MSTSWSHEVNYDRLSEQYGNQIADVKVTYDCRICGKQLLSELDRVRHEAEHPILIPSIFLNGREVYSSEITITAQLSKTCLYIRNVDVLKVNGKVCSEDDFLEMLTSKAKTTLDVIYENSSGSKTLKIRVCLADVNEVRAVESAFFDCFESKALSDLTVKMFVDRVKSLGSVEPYSDGLLRYIQGLMAKDLKSDTDKFKNFNELFNQSSRSLLAYDTELSRTIRSVINFNRNDFHAVFCKHHPMLRNAAIFFQGSELVRNEHPNGLSGLPIDYASEYIFSNFLESYEAYGLADIEANIAAISPQYLSPQDKSKLNYICWRKSVQTGDSYGESRYMKALAYDNVFSEILELK